MNWWMSVHQLLRKHLLEATKRWGAPLLDEPDRHRVAVEFAIAGLDGGDDDEDGVQEPEDGQKNKADQDEAENGRDSAVDQHRDLEVHGFFPVSIELGSVIAFDQPEDERPEKVTREMEEDAEQGAGVDERAPGADVGDGRDVGGG